MPAAQAARPWALGPGPWPLAPGPHTQRTEPSSSSTSLTLQGPMSHWQVSAVASAFSLQEKAGRGPENMILKAPGSQEGKRE
jgi:hypothetical protein